MNSIEQLLAALVGSQQQNVKKKPEPSSVGRVTDNISYRLFTHGKQARIGFGDTNPNDSQKPGWTLSLGNLPQAFSAICTALESFGSDHSRREGALLAKAAYERLSDQVIDSELPVTNGADPSGKVHDLRM